MADDKKTEKEKPSKEVVRRGDEVFNVIHSIEKTKPPAAK